MAFSCLTHFCTTFGKWEYIFLTLFVSILCISILPGIHHATIYAAAIDLDTTVVILMLFICILLYIF